MLQGNSNSKNREISYLSSSSIEEEELDPTGKTVEKLDDFVAKIEKHDVRRGMLSSPNR